MPAWQTFIWVTKGLLVSLTFIVLLRGVATNEVDKVPHYKDLFLKGHTTKTSRTKELNDPVNCEFTFQKAKDISAL